MISNDDDYKDSIHKMKQSIIFYIKPKDKHESFIDRIPEQYKRKDYIIDKLNCKKRNVE